MCNTCILTHMYLCSNSNKQIGGLQSMWGKYFPRDGQILPYIETKVVYNTQVGLKYLLINIKRFRYQIFSMQSQLMV